MESVNTNKSGGITSNDREGDLNNRLGYNSLFIYTINPSGYCYYSELADLLVLSECFIHTHTHTHIKQ